MKVSALIPSNKLLPIEWLRAFSVISVLIYHFDKNLLPGGFLGVDMFFVISGYLVGGHIIRMSKQGEFNIKSYMLKRFWRLYPALAVTIFLSLLFGYLTSTSFEYEDHAISSVLSILALSNIFFWLESGYFGGAAHFNYLLHTWSLSLEWQYYIFSAVFAVIFSKFFKATGFIFLMLVGFASFLCCLYFSNTHSFSFFNLPTRLWEFLAGTLAWRLSSLKNIRIGNTLSLICLIFGVFCCFFCVCLMSEANELPNIYTLVPVLGTFIFLLGVTWTPSEAIKNFFYPLTILGVLSYSIYLIHWPLLVFYPVDSSSNIIGIVFILSMIFILSFCMWFFVERECIKSSGFVRIFILVLMLFILILSFVIYIKGGLLARLDENKISIEQAMKDYNEDRRFCLNSLGRSDVNPLNPNCLNNANFPGDNKNIIFWGDSHLETLRAPFVANKNDGSLNFLFAGVAGCPPIVGLERLAGSKNCTAYSDSMMSFLEFNSERIKLVILGARYPLYLYGSSHKLGNAEPVEGAAIRFPLVLADVASDIDKFRTLFYEQIKRLDRLGFKVLLIGGIPEFGVNVPRYYFSNANAFFYNDQIDLVIKKSDVNARWSEIDLIQKVFSEKFDSVYYFDVKDILCDKEFCFSKKNGSIIYFDDDHLNNNGANLLFPYISKTISKVLEE